MLDPESLLAWRRRDASRWEARDVMLYALSLGLGRDPMNADRLPFIYEGVGLKVLPTFAAVVVRLGFLDGFGIDFARVVHGEQRLVLHRTLAAVGAIEAETRVSDVFDKGPQHGALILIESRATCAATGETLFSLHTSAFARGDGGFGGRPGGPARRSMPARTADLTVPFETQPEQALLYRLNGDRNPLHADPAVARRGGFPRPILHGLCSYGVAGWLILERFCNWDESRIAELGVRFAAPVYPGETILFEFWEDGAIISFRGRVAERNVIVLDGGHCLLRPPVNLSPVVEKE